MKHRVPMTLIFIGVLIVAWALFRLFASGPHSMKSDQDSSTVTPALVKFWASRRHAEHLSALSQEGKGASFDVNVPVVTARIEECQVDWITRLTASLRWPFSRPVERGREPMVIKNGRKESLTLSLIPARAHRHSSWTIPPGLTWRSHTDIAQRWLFADHGRCLFYVTAGNEPLHLVVRSAP
jgi:hypothetical protein